MMATRVAVFIDYQNVYRGARRAFFNESDPGVLGQIDPWRLALLLRGMRGETRELVAVHVFRGLPTPAKDRPATPLLSGKLLSGATKNLSPR